MKHKAQWLSRHGDGVDRYGRRAHGRMRAGRKTTALVFGVLTAFGICGEAAHTEDKPLRLAQGSSTRISAPSMIFAKPASQAPFPIQLESTEALPTRTYVLIRGLPFGASLAGGHVIGQGSWAVPLFALRALIVNIPAGSAGGFELIVGLVTVEGMHLAEARTMLVIGPTELMSLRPEQARPADKAPEPGAQILVPAQPAGRPERGLSSPSLAREPSGEERALAERLVAQGERYFRLGDIVSARLFFRRAADWGSALAALRLAATYDPVELLRLQMQGVTADRAEARKWYERARELGASEAQEALARLGG